MIDPDDLVDASGVAQLLGLSHRNSVTTYLKRYPEMPRPIVDLSSSRCRLWLRSDILDWIETHETRGRTSRGP